MNKIFICNEYKTIAKRQAINKTIGRIGSMFDEIKKNISAEERKKKIKKCKKVQKMRQKKDYI